MSSPFFYVDKNGKLRKASGEPSKEENKIKSDASVEGKPMVLNPFDKTELRKVEIQNEPDWKLTEEEQALKRGITVEKLREQKNQMRLRNLKRTTEAWELLKIAEKNYAEYKQIEGSIPESTKELLRELKKVKRLDYASKNGQSVNLNELIDVINMEDRGEYFTINLPENYNEMLEEIKKLEKDGNEIGADALKVKADEIYQKAKNDRAINFAEAKGWEIDDKGKVNIPASYFDDVKFPITIKGKKYNSAEEVNKSINKMDKVAEWKREKKKENKIKVDVDGETKNALFYGRYSGVRTSDNALELFLSQDGISEKDREEIKASLNLIRLGRLKAKEEGIEKTSIKNLLEMGEKELENVRDKRSLEMYGGLKEKADKERMEGLTMPDAVEKAVADEIEKTIMTDIGFKPEIIDKNGDIKDVTEDWKKEFGLTSWKGKPVKGRLETPEEILKAGKEVRYSQSVKQSLEEQKNLPISNLMGDDWSTWDAKRRRSFLYGMLARSEDTNEPSVGLDNFMAILQDAKDEYVAKHGEDSLFVNEITKDGQMKVKSNYKKALDEFIEDTIKKDFTDNTQILERKLAGLEKREESLGKEPTDEKDKIEWVKELGKIKNKKDELIKRLDSDATVRDKEGNIQVIKSGNKEISFPSSVFKAMERAEERIKRSPKSQFTQPYSEDYIENYMEIYGKKPEMYAGEDSGLGSKKNPLMARQESESARVKFMNEETEKLNNEAFTDRYYSVVKKIEELKQLGETLKGDGTYIDNNKEITSLEGEREEIKKNKQQFKKKWSLKKYLGKLNDLENTRVYKEAKPTKMKRTGGVYDVIQTDEYDHATGKVRKNVIRRVMRRNGLLNNLTEKQKDNYIRRMMKSALQTGGISGKDTSFLFKFITDNNPKSRTYGKKVIELKSPDELKETNQKRLLVVRDKITKDEDSGDILRSKGTGKSIVVVDKNVVKDLRDMILDKDNKENRSGLDGIRYYSDGRPVFSIEEILNANSRTRYREKSRTEKALKVREKSDRREMEKWIARNNYTFKDEKSKKAFFESFRRSNSEVSEGLT